MKIPLNIIESTRLYKAMIGIGGIGWGQAFAIDGNHTLGREESRLGHFLDIKDYCKLHIISHYVQTLLGPGFIAIPAGKVGYDEAGKRLLSEMDEAGIDVRYIQHTAEGQTLFSLCFIYPDQSGGNLTIDNSASNFVDDAFVTNLEPEFALYASRGIALAAPEVPLAARRKLLELATKYHFFRIASFPFGEMTRAAKEGTFRWVDFLAINLDEASSLLPHYDEKMKSAEIVCIAVNTLREFNDQMLISITAGQEGSWSWDGKSLSYIPAITVEAVCTAGAGDAHLAGMIVGLSTQLPLKTAQELGTLVAALSVTSPHTINEEIDKMSLREFVYRLGIPVSYELSVLLS